MEHFNSELRAQENCIASPSNKSVHDSHRKGKYYTTSGLFGQTSKVACVYCSRERHSSFKCTNVPIISLGKLFFVKTRGASHA